MSRTTQIIGLHKDAEDFLESNAKRIPIKKCECCNHVIESGLDKYESGHFSGMFGEKYPLYSYRLKDGRQAHETVQCAPWSGGPCIFLFLMIGKKKMFEWNNKEINQHA